MLKKKNISGMIFYLLILFIEYRFFFLIRIPDVIQRAMTYHNKMILLSVIVIFTITFGLYKRKIVFTNYIFFFLLIVFLSSIYSYFKYHPTSEEILVPLAAYCCILLYFPLRKIFSNSFEECVKLLTLFNIIACLVLFLQFIIYDLNGNIFLSIYEFYRSGEVAVRDNHIRITYLGTAISLSSVISVGYLFSAKNQKLTHLINVVFSIVYFYFVSQTRMYVFALLAVVIFQYNVGAGNKNKNHVKMFLWIIFVVTIFFSFGLYDYIYSILAPIFDGSYTSIGSYYARLDALEYFTEVIINNPLTGNGLLKPNRGSIYYHIIHSFSGNATYSDVGILGVTAQFGIPMLLWYLFLMKKMFRILKIAKKPILHSLFLFTIFTSLTLIVLDPQRIFFIAFTLAIFDYELSTIEKEKQCLKLQ